MQLVLLGIRSGRLQSKLWCARVVVISKKIAYPCQPNTSISKLDTGILNDNYRLLTKS